MPTAAAQVGRRETGPKKKTKKKALNTIPLSSTEMKTLKDLLRKEEKAHLILLIDELATLKSVPHHYRIMLAELGRNTPVCGMMQLGRDERCLQIITDISESGDNILDSINIDRMSIIQQQVPVIASF